MTAAAYAAAMARGEQPDEPIASDVANQAWSAYYASGQVGAVGWAEASWALAAAAGDLEVSTLRTERDAALAEVERLHERIERIGQAHAVTMRLALGRVDDVIAWAKSRIAYCAEVEERYLKAHRYDIPLEPVERRQEKRTLEAVLAMLDARGAP